MHHANNANGTARDLLDQIAPALDTKERLSPQQLLDRARFFEVDSYIRVTLYSAVDGEITTQIIGITKLSAAAVQIANRPSSSVVLLGSTSVSRTLMNLK